MMTYGATEELLTQRLTWLNLMLPMVIFRNPENDPPTLDDLHSEIQDELYHQMDDCDDLNCDCMTEWARTYFDNMSYEWAERANIR